MVRKISNFILLLLGWLFLGIGTLIILSGSGFCMAGKFFIEHIWWETDFDPEK